MKAVSRTNKLFGVLIAGAVLTGCASTPVGWEKTKSHGATYTEGQCLPNNDADGDGVVNNLDQCPATPLGTIVDEVGCPVVEEISLDGVNFEYKSSNLTMEAKGILDSVVEVLNNSEVNFTIEGHTDSVASESYNQKLSQSRAESVRAYLMSKGISADRMTAQGFGESNPIASNDTEDGRADNRRVEFSVQ